MRAQGLLAKIFRHPYSAPGSGFQSFGWAGHAPATFCQCPCSVKAPGALNCHCSQKRPLSTAVLTQSWSEQNWRGLWEKPKHLVRDPGNTVLPNLPMRRDGKGTAFAIYLCSFLLHGFSLVRQKTCSLLFCFFLSFAEVFFFFFFYTQDI